MKERPPAEELWSTRRERQTLTEQGLSGERVPGGKKGTSATRIEKALVFNIDGWLAEGR